MSPSAERPTQVEGHALVPFSATGLSSGLARALATRLHDPAFGGALPVRETWGHTGGNEVEMTRLAVGAQAALRSAICWVSAA